VGESLLDIIISTLSGLNYLFFDDILSQVRSLLVKPIVVVVVIPILQAITWGL